MTANFHLEMGTILVPLNWTHLNGHTRNYYIFDLFFTMVNNMTIKAKFWLSLKDLPDPRRIK